MAAFAGVCPGQVVIVPDTLPAAPASVAYSQTISATPAAAYTWTITQGSLPPGMTGNTISAGGATQFSIAGTPTIAGSYDFTLRAAANQVSGGQLVGLKQYTIVVANTLAFLTASPLPSGTVAVAYSTTIVAVGGTPPYSFTTVPSALPLGMTLSRTGVLSGVTSTPGTYNFQVSVTDAAVTFVTKPYVLTISPAITPVVVSTTSPLPIGSAGKFYTLPLSASGGTPPYTFAATGNLPPGLGLSTQGLISGTPTTAGIYNFVVTATDSARATGSKPFQLPIGTAGQSLLLLNTNLTFTAPVGGDPTSPQTVLALSATASSVQFIALGDDGAGGPLPVWLFGKPIKGATPARILLAADPGNLAAGVYNARVRVFSGTEAPVDVAVRFVVTAPKPQLRAIPAVLRSYLRFSQPGTQDLYLQVQNPGGGGPIPFQASVTGASPWVSLLASSNQTAPGKPALVRVRFNSQGLGIGVYRDTVHITSANGNDDVLLTLFVYGDGPILRLPVTGTVLTARQGHTQNAKAVVRVLNVGSLDSQINYTVDVLSNPSFLTVTPSSFKVTPVNPATLTLTLTPGADTLTPGAYYALVRVSDRGAFNSPQFLSVVLVVQEANSVSSLEVSQAGLYFQGGSAFPTSSKQFQVFSSSADSTPFSVAANTDAGGNWLSATPAQGNVSNSNPGTVTVSVNSNGLKSGVYFGEVDVSLGSTLRAVHVTLVVPPGQGAGAEPESRAPQERSGERTRDLACTPSQVVVTPAGLPLNFSVPASWPATISVQLSDDCGTPIAGAAASVVAKFDSGDLPLTLYDPQQDASFATDWTPLYPLSPTSITFTASSGTLQPGTITLSGGVNTNSFGPPVLFDGGTVNNANPLGGSIMAPGTVAAIYGQNLASSTVSPGVVPLATTFNGTLVSVGGAIAPLFFLSNGQLNVQIPAELPPNQTYPIAIAVNNSFAVLPNGITVVGATPGVVSLPDGHVIAQHADYTLVNASNPAKPGETIILYLTGLGATNPAVASGQPAPSTPPLATVTVPPTVTLDGQPASFVFAGLTPGGIGLYQINLTIPANARTGDLEMVIKQGGIVANSTKVPVAK